MELVRELEALAPFGLGNPSPLFLGEGLRLERRRACGAQGAHLQITLRQGDSTLDGIAFGMGPQAAALPQGVDVVYRLARNTFRGLLPCSARPRPSARPGGLSRPWPPPPGGFRHGLGGRAAGGAGFDCGPGPPSRKRTCGSERIELPRGKSSWEDTGKRPEKPWLSPGPGRPVRWPVPGRAPTGWFPHPRKGRARRRLLCWRVAQDPLCFPTALAQPVLGQVQGHWRQVWLLDGELCPGEAEWWRERLPKAQVHGGPPSRALRSLAASLDAGDEAYRGLYRQLRAHAFATLAQAAQAAGLTLPQARVGLLAFHQLGLIRYTESPFAYALCNAPRCSLGDSPLLKAIRALNA